MVDLTLDMERRICEFGFPGPLRDQLVDAVLSGDKTATSSLLVDWERDGEQPPAAGELQTVVDSAGLPVAIIEILGSEVVALGAVDDRVARAEGESYKTAAGWRAAHERFWREEVFPGWEGDQPVLDDATPIVVEWFRLTRLI
ncbi:MAG TPA: ASCH domain-containing protein [Solirubrobacteraceae bacterium]|nr:ASCH domain-containing protein [Solirubrobacteraceae bacterium]